MPHFPANKWLSHVLLLVSSLAEEDTLLVTRTIAGADERHITEKQPHK